jgi:hypothetical protein
MDLSTTAAAIPQGIKRKLNKLYESMCETPRKYKKVKHPAFDDSKAYRKHESRIIADYHFSTAGCHEQASALCKEAVLKSLFFQCKPNSYTFDFGLGSNTQSKSRAHHDTMYLYRGYASSLPVEYLSYICVPSLAPSPAPILASLPAPSSSGSIQDTSMDVVEMPELPSSQPSRLGKSMLRKKDSIDVATYDMRRSLNDSLEEPKKPKKRAAKSTKLEKPKGITKTKKTKVRKPVMHGPFMIDDSDDEEEEEEKKNTVNNDSQSVVDSTSTTTTTPAPGLSFSLPIHHGPPPPTQTAPAPPTSSSTTTMTSATATRKHLPASWNCRLLLFPGQLDR